MSNYFTVKLVDRMIQNNVIDCSKREEYLYTVQILIEKYIGFFLIYFIAFFFGTVRETTLFLLPYITIRKYSGGFHCKTETGCLFLSQIFVVVSVLVEVPILLKHIFITKVLFIIMIGFIFIVGSINHPNLNWTKIEFKRSKKLSIRTTGLWAVLLVILRFIGISYEVLVYFITGIINVSFLMMIAKILKQEVKKYDEED